MANHPAGQSPMIRPVMDGGLYFAPGRLKIQTLQFVMWRGVSLTAMCEQRLAARTQRTSLNRKRSTGRKRAHWPDGSLVTSNPIIRCLGPENDPWPVRGADLANEVSIDGVVRPVVNG
jgi:hypothetical protein